MASFKRQKEALRAALYAFIAGAHYVTEEVERAQSITASGSGADATEGRQVMLEADYERLLESPQAVEMLVEYLNEEDMYPYGAEWPGEAFSELIQKLIAPQLSITSGSESDMRFRFKKGFKELLNTFAEAVEGMKKDRSTLDHWMVLLINGAFQCGVTAAARSAENSKVYYSVVPSIEEETEPWSRYPQLADVLDQQLKRETRRKGGLVTDFDD